MNIRLFVIAFITSIVSLVFSLMMGETVDVFPLDAPVENPYYTSELVVGPSGDIWFTLGDPKRIMRVSQNGLESMLNTDLPGPAVDLTVSPDGAIWLDDCRYIYSPDAGLSRTDVIVPWEDEYYCYVDVPATFDADMRIYCVWHGYYTVPWGPRPPGIWEIVPGERPIPRYGAEAGTLSWPVFVSIGECWTMHTARYWPTRMLKIDLDSGAITMELETDERWFGPLSARDADGVLWIVSDEIDIVTFDGDEFSIFAEGEPHKLIYGDPVLAADGAVWSQKKDSLGGTGILRFRGGETRTFTTDDGLLTNGSYYHHPIIDYDGNVWVVNYSGLTEGHTPECVGMSRITDGGWPPMRLMLHEVETEGTIAVEAQVINNGPVVGVDVYLALELNGQLLYWPNWQLEPYANHINLRPGHNQTATIIEARREDIPPGSYTFWGCMTGRNTSKLIGPIDRKFENLTVEVEGR